ncbi:MAG: hypothetical protein WBR10_02930 [Candidatus Acidiferrum sp.]
MRYDSIAKMQTHFEQIDVENEEYETWDAAGTRLKMSVQKADEWLRIEPMPNPQPGQLADAITDFAHRQGVDVDISLLHAGDFSRVLEQVSSAIHAKWHSKTWWQKFKRRF